ncbi:MAG: oligosaccharide flippase family protein, partial [Anaerolineae bacterium]|nr:oligosaccharide flippase family protein [Anaerolineae bacterium]
MASQLLIKLLSFGFSILIVRDLGANDYGQYAAVLAFGITFAFLSDLGLGTYSVREIARLRDQPDGLARAEVIFGSVLRLRLLLSLGTMILVTAAAWLSGRSLMMVGAVALNSIGLLLYAVQGASDATLSGFERLDITAGARVIYQVVFVGLGGIALLVGLGYYGLILANLAGIAVMAFL